MMTDGAKAHFKNTLKRFKIKAKENNDMYFEALIKAMSIYLHSSKRLHKDCFEAEFTEQLSEEEK